MSSSLANTTGNDGVDTPVNDGIDTAANNGADADAELTHYQQELPPLAKSMIMLVRARSCAISLSSMKRAANPS